MSRSPASISGGMFTVTGDVATDHVSAYVVIVARAMSSAAASAISIAIPKQRNCVAHDADAVVSNALDRHCDSIAKFGDEPAVSDSSVQPVRGVVASFAG
jgi:hypothetical protein